MPGWRAVRLFWGAVGIPLLLVSCNPHGGKEQGAAKSAVSDEPLMICTGTSYSILPIIAQEKGLFAKEGLKVELKAYAIGRDAMEAMLAGACDVATTADTPVADYGVSRDDLRVITGIAKSDCLNCIVAARESGIHKVTDLKGRVIGVTKGTAPHFFLDLVLNKNRMTERDIKLQFMKGDELNRAIADRKLDAIVTTDMNGYRLKESLGDKVTLMAEPGIAMNYGYLTVLDPTLEKRKGDLKRMLLALKSAERIVEDKPEEAKQLFASYLKASSGVTSQLWSNIVPRLSLDSAMVLTLEDNARWLRERERSAPVNKSFRDIIRPELLKEIAPERVRY